MKRSKLEKSGLDLKAALALINRGRKALKLRPLAALPIGIMDDPEECPLGRALKAGIGTKDQECVYCGCDKTTAHMDTPKQAQALAKAWGTASEDIWVTVPFLLARFNAEHKRGLHPELIDREWLTVEEAAKLTGCPEETIQKAVQGGLVPTLTTAQCGETYVRRSSLAQVGVAMSTE
jgi:excisionase family DNA binding protein